LSFDNWLRLVPARREPRLRFVCFPHAGGSASFFRSWAGHLPDGVELAAACYPGREDRIADPLPRRMADLAGPLATACARLPELPMVCFGHSMAASVAYETALGLERDYGVSVAALCVSGRAAPGYERVREPVPDHDDALAREVARLGGTERAVLDGELRELVLPVIRADYRLTARYDGDHSTAPVSAPLIAYYGLADEDLRAHSVMAWSAFTRAEFSPRAMPGGHFNLNDDTAGLVRDILNQVGVARRQESVILR
jgi:pyochelin biosynthetic protein PchC